MISISKSSSIISLSLLLHACIGINASEQSLLPYADLPTKEHAVHEQFINAIRENNVQKVEELTNLRPSLRLTAYSGNISPLHLAASIEHFSQQDPQEMIDLLVDKSLYNKPANVNNPIYHYMCTGEKIESNSIQRERLKLNPVQLAARYASVLTLAALVRHTHISHIIMQMPVFDENFDLYARIIECEKSSRIRETKHGIPTPIRVTVKPFIKLRLVEKVIKLFGLRGMELLHKNGLHLSDGLGDDMYIGDNEPTAFDFFEKHHPTKVHEVAHLRPVPVGLFTGLINWWNGTPAPTVEYRTLSSASSSSSSYSATCTTKAVQRRYIPVNDDNNSSALCDDNFELYAQRIKSRMRFVTREVSAIPTPVMVTEGPIINRGLAERFIQLFGLRGMEFLHQQGYDLSRKFFGEYVQGDEPDAFDLFAIHHPQHVNEIAHLRPASIISQIFNVFTNESEEVVYKALTPSSTASSSLATCVTDDE